MTVPEDVQAAVKGLRSEVETELPRSTWIASDGEHVEAADRSLMLAIQSVLDLLAAETARADAAEEVAKAARAYRVVRPAFWDGAGHSENDEISCSCGFVSQASSYEGARKSLERHISAKIKADAESRERTVSQFDAALARYDAANSHDRS